MTVWRCILTGLLALTGVHAWAADQPVPKLAPAVLAQAVTDDSFSVPTPGELLAALNKVGKPNWQAQYRPPIPTAYTSRPQIALNLGGLIADGYLAVEAEDSQQVKNIGKDIINLAKALGVSKSILARGSSITDFAEKNEWNTLKEELEETQNEVKQAMTDQHDQESRTHFLDVAEGYFELTCKEIANAHVGSTPDDDHESVDDNKRAGADSGIASQRSGHVTVQMVDGLASSEGAGAMLRWARTAAER